MAPRKMTPEQLEKLAAARAKAAEVKRAMKEANEQETVNILQAKIDRIKKGKKPAASEISEEPPKAPPEAPPEPPPEPPPPEAPPTHVRGLVDPVLLQPLLGRRGHEALASPPAISAL